MLEDSMGLLTGPALNVGSTEPSPQVPRHAPNVNMSALHDGSHLGIGLREPAHVGLPPGLPAESDRFSALLLV